MSRKVKVKGKKQGNLIDDIALGFTTILGITGAAAGVFIPGAAIPVAAIQAGAYCPAVVAAIVKRSAHDRRSSEQINVQINSCAELTAKEYLEELKTDRPVMYSLFRDVWEKEDIYDQSPTLGSIEENMKEFLVTETRWEGYGITPKDINDVVDTYVQRFFINAKDYPELNQSILLGVSKRTDELEARQDVLEDKMDGLASSGKKDIRAFYEHIYGEFTKIPKSDLYGKISLRDGYIEPMIDDDGRTQSVREYLESWVESASTITVVGGEPGHGKTSLCWKAMCDFYKDGWLRDKVDNVFCFSLNPAKTDALANDSFYLYSLLSWGNDRKNPKHLLDVSDCKNALIFFDGFDELLEWRPSFSLVQFIENEIIPFQEDTGSHIVITTRSMAIKPDTDYYNLFNGAQVPINRLQLVKKEQQIDWIGLYIERCRDTSPQKATELEEYLKDFKKFREDDDLKQVLGVPIIFRMIVEARYFPKKKQSIFRIYDELFRITWKRHYHLENEANTEQRTKRRLQDLALKIFIGDNDTIEIEIEDTLPWLFSFYTTHEGKKRIGFLHRSFYQYFLAYKVLSWYRDYAESKADGLFKNHLSYLARRKIDKTTLEFIKELYDSNEDKEALEKSFDDAYEILKDTDGFLPLPKGGKDAGRIRLVKPIIRAKNTFCNIISIGSICGQKITPDSLNIEALRTYGLSGGILLDATLIGKDSLPDHLNDRDFRWLLFNEFMRDEKSGELYSTNLRGVDLKNADLSGSHLRHADLGRADLRFADLIGIDLRNTYLSGASLGRARLIGANLECVYLGMANLSGADLRGASLEGADLNRADLRDADLRFADLIGAILSGADLSGADLRFALLSNASIKINGHWRGVYNEKIKLDKAKMEKHNADYLKTIGCDISNVIITD